MGAITHLRRLTRALVVVVDGGGWADCRRRRQWMGGGGGGKTMRDVAVMHYRIWRPAARGTVGGHIMQSNLVDINASVAQLARALVGTCC